MRIILLRHGNTIKEKRNPNRVLSAVGISKLQRVAKSIMMFAGEEVIIASTETVRAKQSAEILRSALKIKNKPITDDFRLKGIDKIEKLIASNELRGHRPAQTYLDLVEYSKFGVESPKIFARRITKILKKIGASCVIIISHECSLEAFMIGAKPARTIFKSFDEFFDYADFAVLEI